MDLVVDPNQDILKSLVKEIMSFKKRFNKDDCMKGFEHFINDVQINLTLDQPMTRPLSYPHFPNKKYSDKRKFSQRNLKRLKKIVEIDQNTDSSSSSSESDDEKDLENILYSDEGNEMDNKHIGDNQKNVDTEDSKETKEEAIQNNTVPYKLKLRTHLERRSKVEKMLQNYEMFFTDSHSDKD